MNLFAAREDEKRSAAIRNLKELARLLFDANGDDAVVVNELACTEPGCPPVETVISLLRAGSGPRQLKVHKPAVDVTEADVRAAHDPQLDAENSTRHDQSCDCAAHCQDASVSKGTGLWTALVPILACAMCPVCLTTYSKVFAVLGIAFGLSEQEHSMLLLVAVGLSLGVSGWRASRTHRLGPFMIALAGSLLVAGGHFAGDSAALEWSGIFALVLGSLSESVRKAAL